MGDLEILIFVFWQKDKNYCWWIEDENGWGCLMWVVGICFYYQIICNFVMQYELGYEYLDDKNYKGVNGKGKGGLIKVIVVLMLIFDFGFWVCLQLCFFVIYVKWDKGVFDVLDGNYNWDINIIIVGGYFCSGFIDIVNFGVQVEVWF